MKLNLSNLSGIWFDYKGEVKLKLRVQPLTLDLIPSTIGDSDAASQYMESVKIFIYCVVAWAGIYDAKGVPLECDDENKKIIFEFTPDLRDWSLERISELRKEFEIKEKDSKN